MYKTLMDVLLSSREVGMSTMRLTLVLTSHEDKRTSRSEAMTMGDYVQLKVFSLVFLMIREKKDWSLLERLLLPCLKLPHLMTRAGKATVRVRDIRRHPRESRATEW
jgi:hypothetical protein